jgi:hypothetical protein
MPLQVGSKLVQSKEVEPERNRGNGLTSADKLAFLISQSHRDEERIIRAGRKALTSVILYLPPENNSVSNRAKVKFETIKLTRSF